MRHTVRAVAAIAIGFALLFTACGGDADDDGQDASATRSAGDLGAAVSSPECEEFAESTSTSNTQAAGTVPDFNDVADALERGKSQIPSDLDDDADVLIAAYRKAATDLSDAGLEAGATIDAGNARQVGTVFQAFGAANIQTAATNLAAWTSRGCK
ncbi:MAG: hypothetical protein WD646_05840 [Actinomycetota bacterium]